MQNSHSEAKDGDKSFLSFVFSALDLWGCQGLLVFTSRVAIGVIIKPLISILNYFLLPHLAFLLH